VSHLTERHFRLTLLSAACLAVIGCERAKTPAPSDSTSAVTTAAPAVATGRTGGSSWLPQLGPALLVEGATATEAVLLGPTEGDSLVQSLQAFATSGAAVTLLGRNGAQISARLAPSAERNDAECTVWGLRDLKPDGTGWSIGFIKAGAQSIAMDSVEVLTARDSMKLVAEVSRLASSVTAPTDGAFQGLRFTTHEVRRFESAPGVQALVAHVIRRVNQEANPQEEQTLLVAERDSGVTAGEYHLVYAERSWGLEDQVTTPEVVGATRLDNRAALVIARDSESGVAYVIMQRESGKRWIVRWTSAPTSCG
jgi:hypothetical protein